MQTSDDDEEAALTEPGNMSLSADKWWHIGGDARRCLSWWLCCIAFVGAWVGLSILAAWGLPRLHE